MKKSKLSSVKSQVWKEIINCPPAPEGGVWGVQLTQAHINKHINTNRLLKTTNQFPPLGG